MRISFAPQRRDGTFTASKLGDILTINGEAFDFSVVPDGATVPAGTVPCEWIVGPVERVDGQLRLTFILPHGPNPSPAVAFPTMLVDPPDGVLAIPSDEERANVEA